MKTTPSKYSFKLSACRCCGGTSLQSVLDLGHQPLANNLTETDENIEEYPLVLLRCRTCSLFQLKHTVDPEKLFSNYLYRSAINQKFIDHFSSLAQYLQDMLEKEDFVLDVGCNDGVLLEALKDRGIESVGVDYSSFDADWQEKGVTAYSDDFTDINFPQKLIENAGYPKVITACNVFAHVDDIHGFIRNVDRTLAPHGYFIIEVVDIEKMIASGSFDMIYHEHLFYYDLTTLKNLLGLHGFSLVAFESVDTHGGSIRAVFTRSAYPSRRLLQSNTNIAPFLVKIKTDKDSMNKRLKTLASQKIVGFGAPAKATVLAHYYGIDDGYIELVIDDNKDKQNKYIPNTGMKIIPWSEDTVKSADHIFIFAWNFAENIKERCVRAGFEGEFIVPFQ